ncbi:glycoside hydrolase family 89 protein [Macroventuria anomochaeta]|uniref:Glycoside hydrolase family 89 protein n=1 Tax=Macroventuria anomochaeta TaxID=301207 RepID=A0ACB6RYQ9_9PLEO|nr:glycoside hydrolase family 89 protein [Macroventuria anomochaeta]KAF2626397.1 glycoside hydrolase family 89 protein [Macroventuria anomochaeta]
MRTSILGLWACTWTTALTTSTSGLYSLIERRLPSHSGQFEFHLEEAHNTSVAQNSKYAISTASNGSVIICGGSLSALSVGLRHYLSDVAHVDIYWFIGNELDKAASPLPGINGTITRQSTVPWRYFFNTVTFSYTTPFWSWKDWELELDWLALHGVNLPLAWVGYEKILLDVFQEIGLTDDEILPFFSGPAFQAWNRLGNIQGSWSGELPRSWIDSQFELQKQILERMLELGMTPILPAFTGFGPRALTDLYPNATIVNGSRWEDFPPEYTKTTFLEPSDPLFADLQNRVISKQVEYYGNITQFYTLDQYNENDPYSGDLSYLRNITRGTWQSLKAANTAAVWVMQGWLFYSNENFWTKERIEAYLSGVEEDSDMLILDLFSESQPQWQRTNSYYGKPWIWNELHNYGGNMGLYGQIDNVTIDPIEALASSSSLVGFGLTPEGQEGNEIIYSLLLDQAWQSSPIDTKQYFHDWVTTRYSHSSNCTSAPSLPSSLYTTWELLRTSAYNNTNLKSNAVPKNIFELAPNITGLVNRTGHHPTTLNYNTSVVFEAWKFLLSAAEEKEELWEHAAYQHDLVDITRQVFANEFLSAYNTLISTWNSSTPSANTTSTISSLSTTLLANLQTLDILLLALPQFRLSTWLESARARAGNNTQLADFYAYTALNQITLWGPDGEINDYASKQWGGLVGPYYGKRWEVFLDYLGTVTPKTYNATVARDDVKAVETAFQLTGLRSALETNGQEKSVREVVEEYVLPFLRSIGLL